MEKRKLAKIPREEASDEMVRFAERAAGTHIVTTKDIEKDLLMVTFYPIRKLKKGKKDAQLRTFFSKNDYISQDLTVPIYQEVLNYNGRSNGMIKILLSKKLGEMRLTQADLARATGIRPNTINELYHELADRVNLEHLDLICEALDCELDELIVRVPNKESAITHTRQGTQKPGRKR